MNTRMLKQLLGVLDLDAKIMELINNKAVLKDINVLFDVDKGMELEVIYLNRQFEIELPMRFNIDHYDLQTIRLLKEIVNLWKEGKR